MRGPVAILCSGQGAQHQAMFDIVADAPEAQPVFAAAAAVLGADPRDYVGSARPDALYSNLSGQILVCTLTLATWAALGALKPARAIIAGYSVGELAAWGCGALFDVETTLRVARRRAEVMDAAAPPDGGLAGIVGLPQPILEPILARHGTFLAIDNGPDSVVVGGTKPALEAVCREAAASGARHVVMIHVTVPSHTPLLAAATPELAHILHDAKPVPPPLRYRVLTGIDGGSISDVNDAIDKLARQISTPVAWAACLDSCYSAGATTALELGPGNALSRMASERFPAWAVRSAADFRTIAGVREWLQRVEDRAIS